MCDTRFVTFVNVTSLAQGRVMVVKKKAAKVEAVVLDEEKLLKLIGNVAKLLMNKSTVVIKKT